MILLIDNYDSFSYNLYQLIGKINSDIKIIRNDELSVEEIINLRPKAIVISPGPGKPEDAGVSVELIKSVKDMPWAPGYLRGFRSKGLLCQKIDAR